MDDTITPIFGLRACYGHVCLGIDYVFKCVLIHFCCTSKLFRYFSCSVPGLVLFMSTLVQFLSGMLQSFKLKPI